MNSKWKMYKIGLVDFWYYDEQEFYFLDGRMLLRGANGSGKSVTMQSFIPLLLDGNMRPERLDPFGSRARKMENYLLEEGDGRDERTGYLYMEFKRKETESYITIGIGIRARKGKKLDSWYFCINDGRRIGKDIFLYKDLDQKIVYTKTELRNRIGDGGKVMESQKEYAQCVNHYLFGFETMEEYKEMLELLIQLRTPKLSKDFKPTIINDILGNSLQTLSEDDLRPMSEAIENMDGLKTNLDNLKESLKSAKQIERAYDQYNEIVLYNKALLYKKSCEEYGRYEKEIKETEDQISSSAQDYEKEQAHHEQLQQEQAVRIQEKNSLEDNDATKLKEQEQKLQKDIDEFYKKIEEKKRQYQGKEEKRIQIDGQIKKAQDERDLSWESIKENLDEMEEYMQEVSFDEFSFMKDELVKNPEEVYNFSTHRNLLKRYMTRISEGIEVLEEEKNTRIQYDSQLKKMDEYRKERDQAEREYHQYEVQLSETKDEMIERIYQWEKSNELIKMDPPVLQEMTRSINDYEDGADESLILDAVRNKRYGIEDDLRKDRQLLVMEKEAVQTELEEKEKELKEWINQKDPEPEQSPEVLRNREVLQENGISYLQFYKTIEFGDELSEKKKNDLEEAFLRMGILDALIVDAGDRERILSLDQGTCDKYIFNDAASVKENIGELFEIENDDNDILFYQKVSKILSGIGYEAGEETGQTWIDARGHFKSGILEGTITGEYESKFIGVKAREKYRSRQIEMLEGVCAELSRKLSDLKDKLLTSEQMLEQLIKEERNFPDFEDLKVAARELMQKDHLLTMKNQQVSEQQEVLEQQRKQLDEIRLQVQKICSAADLTIRLDVFLQARDDLTEYQNLLMQLQLNHQTFLSKIKEIQVKEEHREEILQDMDDILYDQGQTERKWKEAGLSRRMILDQLELTDYESIKAKLDECIGRLAKLPKEMEESVERKTSLKKDKEQFEKQLTEQKERYLKQRSVMNRLKEVFAAEYQLGYVPKEYVETEDWRDQANKVCKMLAGRFEKKQQNDIFMNLQEIFQQNRMYLRDYNLNVETLFEELEEQGQMPGFSIKRIDIVGKYRGITVRFKELIEKLENDVEEQTRLLSDKDRELFEDILANTISKKIRGKIQSSRRWVDAMNRLMESMQTSSGLSLSLKWKSKRAEKEEQMDTRTLVQMLQKDVEIMREEEVKQLSAHFRSKIDEARKLMDDSSNVQSFHSIMREVLDYRKWFEFQLEYQKTGEKKKELTDRIFFTFSGGEKAMAMYVPLFSAVVAKYAGARMDAPRIISLDEAFAGVDEMNIKDMFRLMVEFDFDFMMNSQILWGDYETVPSIAIYQLLRPENVKFVTVIPYVWNGNVKTLVKEIGDAVGQA